MTNDKVYNMSISKIYPCLVNKAVRKGRTEEEVDHIINWLTGYTKQQINELISENASYQYFFENAPEMNPKRKQIKGHICGIKIEEIKEPLMKEIRYLDKLIDELAKGKSMDKIVF